MERARHRRAPSARAALLALLFACVASVARATGQQPSSVGAQLSSGIVKLGGEVVLQIVVENGEDVQIGALPEVEGLAFGALRGPSRRSQQTFVNGRISGFTQLTWQVAVRPLRPGDFEIPPIEIEVAGRAAHTRPLRLSAVEDLRGEELGFFELEASAARVYEGEPVELALRFGWAAAIDDTVEVCELSLPWWGNLSGWLELEAPQRDLSRRRIEISLNRSERVDVEDLGAIERNGQRFRGLELRRRFLPTRSGPLELPTSFMTFVSRPRFERGETYYVRAPQLALEVLPLPSEGRPFDFSGAVGRFDVTASVDRRDVDAGESIKLEVEWSGHGNFEFFEPPAIERAEAFRGFRVYGKTETKQSDRRTVVYDVAPLGPETRTIPPVELAYFDTQSESYATIASQPIPIRVRALAGAALEDGAAAGERAQDVRDIHVLAERDEPWPSPGPRALAILFALLPIAWIGLRSAVRRGGDPDAAATRARRAARRELRRELARAKTASAQSAALERFLAARTGTPPLSWSGAWSGAPPPAAPRELGRAGLAPEVEAELAELCASLAQSAWGASDRPLEPARVAAVADHLLGAGL